MENNNKLFGICGSSGSGKSFIVKYVLENLGSDNVSVIYQDNYYKKERNKQKMLMVITILIFLHLSI